MHRPDSEIMAADTPEALLDTAVIEEITNGFEDVWASEYRRYRHDAAEATNQHDKALARELRFAGKVALSVLEMAASYPELTVTSLFDVDETIAKGRYGGADGTEYRTVLRPSLWPILQHVRNQLGPRFEAGILTSRAQSHLDEELSAPTYLSTVMPSINPAFVISARDGELTGQHRMFDPSYHAGARDYLDGFINPDIIVEDEDTTFQKVNEATKSRIHWRDMKLPVLRSLRDDNPDRAFVYFDDASAASVINPLAARVKGVQIYDDALFLL